MSDSFMFRICSPKYGWFTVTAPARFRDEIAGYSWHIDRCKIRSSAAQFTVRTYLARDVGKQRSLHLHVLVWRLMGMPAVSRLDHVDGDPLNNTERNLRPADSAQNQWNRHSLNRNNTSGVVGVHWVKANRKWMAQIRVGGNRRIYLGLFDDIDSARAARIAAAIRYHRDFAVVSIMPSKDVA